LRQIVYGGSPVVPALIPRLREAFPGVRLFQGFGQTETGYCLGLHDADHDGHGESLGRADLFSEIRLLDDDGNEVRNGEPGEIVARTPYLMSGYHADPEASAEYFRYGPDWGRTGDLAARDKDGFYYLSGRKHELMISGGVNVYPAEVERVLLSHPAVHEAAVFGIPNEDWGEAVTALVILRPGWQPRPYAEYTDEGTQADWAGAGKVTSVFPIPIARGGGGISSEDLLQHCRLQLAAFKVPKFLGFAQDFPRTSSGKVRKGELARTLLSGIGDAD
jgi:fatty-acyl-CoA synthase